jgi:hypothetical protein
VAGATVARLGDVVHIDDETGRLIVTADLADVAGVAARRSGGAPNRFGEAVKQMIDARIVAGTALPGRNEEAKAILDAFGKRDPNSQPPSLATVKRYMSENRGGS